MVRKQTKQVSAGTLKIGGGAPISVQSMLNVPADDIAGSVAQAKALEAAGCELIRAAIADLYGVLLIEAIKIVLLVPLVADLHFDSLLALE